MRAPPPAPPPDLAELLDSWILNLKARGKRPATIEQYTVSVRGYLRWCGEYGQPPAIDKPTVTAYVAHLLETGAASTATLRLMALKQFTKWLIEEGELETNPLTEVRPPRTDVKVTTPLTDEELRLLLKACAGKSFRDRRDEAVVRLMAETGMRAGELLGLAVDDVDVARGLATVTTSKSRRGRVVPFGPQTAQALDRYLRVRKSHRLAASPTLWLGDNSRGTISYHGLRDAILGRAELAGIKGFHLHLLRHTAATRWLRAGGSEGGLMAVAGWRRREMIDRYVAATASERAADEARGLGLGDL